MMQNEKEVNTGADFAVETIEICDGFYIDNKLKIGGVLYLESKYGMSINKIQFNDNKVSDSVNLIVALALQRDSNLTEEKALSKLKTLEIEQLLSIEQKLPGVFEADSKN